MPTWPSIFPPLFEVDGFGLDPVSNATMIDTESGEPLTRLRFTGESDDVAGAFPPMERSIARQILDFWRYDLKNGTLRFSWDHPLTGEAMEFLFIAPPKLTVWSADLWKVAVQLKTMPT